jgi:hypothetical protein
MSERKRCVRANRRSRNASPSPFQVYSLRVGPGSLGHDRVSERYPARPSCLRHWGSDGIGKEVARTLGHDGAQVCIGSRNAERLDQSAADLKAEGIDCVWHPCDVRESLDRRG